VPLTPTDVANRQFKFALRGYSVEEVDTFLDEVESELSRLLRDNAELRGAPAGTASPTSGATAAAPLAGLQGQEAALRTLLLAQRTADEAIAEARAEAEQIVTATRAEAESALSAAKEEADQTLRSARAEAETTLGEATSEAESALGKARAEAESTLSASQAKADGLETDIAERIHAATGDLEQKRRSLEARIDELRAFEREYRTRLKAYLETQLRDLDNRQGPDDGGVGVPAGARAAAVGPHPGARRATGAPSAVQERPADAPAADAPAAGAPAGPPRQGQGPPLRPVPSPGGSAATPVGPFTVVPASAPDSRDPGAHSSDS